MACWRSSSIRLRSVMSLKTSTVPGVSPLSSLMGATLSEMGITARSGEDDGGKVSGGFFQLCFNQSGDVFHDENYKPLL